MRHASLFSGIGGFDLAAEWMGWDNIFQVEVNRWAQSVLEKNFPNTKRYGDIKEFDGVPYNGAVDILTGGFPCQPFSVAGKRKGKEDDRYLWPEMLRVISEVRPAFVVGENVTGIIGMALEQVLTSLEAEGYHTETFIIPACAVNAPHRRDRIWILSYSKSYRNKRNSGAMGEAPVKTRKQNDGMQLNGQGENGIITNTNGQRCKEYHLTGIAERARLCGRNAVDGWAKWPSKPGVCRRDDGIPNRVDRIKGLGNAVIPHLVFELFKAIESLSHQHPTNYDRD